MINLNGAVQALSTAMTELSAASAEARIAGNVEMAVTIDQAHDAIIAMQRQIGEIDRAQQPAPQDYSKIEWDNLDVVAE